MVLLLVLVVQLLHWLKPRPAPADLDMLERLEHLERALQLTQMAIAKSDGALGSMGQQVQGLVHQLRAQNQTAAADSLRGVGGHPHAAPEPRKRATAGKSCSSILRSCSKRWPCSCNG